MGNGFFVLSGSSQEWQGFIGICMSRSTKKLRNTN